MKKAYTFIFIFLFIIFGIMAGLMMLGTKKKKEIYNAHSWKQVEASFKNSTSYNKRETHTDSDGDEHEETVTYYTWNYTYTVDGNTYECFDKDHSKGKPENDNYSKTILVAEDDPGIYFMYATEEALKSSFNNGVFSIVVTGIILLSIFGSIMLRGLIVRKTSRLVDKFINDND